MMRRWARNVLFLFLRRLLKTDDAKEWRSNVARASRRSARGQRDPQFDLAACEPPYADRGHAGFADHSSKSAYASLSRPGLAGSGAIYSLLEGHSAQLNLRGTAMADSE